MLVDALQAAGEQRQIGLLDADPARRGSLIYGVPVVGDDDVLAELAAAGTRYFAVGIGAPVSGNNGPRKVLFERAWALGLEPLTIVHPSAVVSAHAVLGQGAQILPAAVVNAGARIGVNSIVNSGAIVEHDCVVGDHVHIATGARLTSTVRVADLVHVGAGAVVRQVVSIGERAVIGIGAAVVADVPPEAVVAGVPAKRLR